MKAFAASLGAIICCFVLTTCGGTIRALNDDYASDAPNVRSVRPTSGVSGEEVTFQAVFCTGIDNPTDPLDTGPTYIWDFGGGCEPNVSYDAEPQVMLRDGLRGPYACTLTVSAGCRGKNTTETYNFTLQVAPLTVLAVTPGTGIASGTATFSALVGTGNATTYSWDFGGACSPGGSNEVSPSVKFSGAAGVYQGRVIVSNSFEATEYPFVITVVDNTP